MKAKEFIGIIPPNLSSFRPNGEIYEKGIREIVNFEVPHVNGLYPTGTYGSGPLMSISERKRVMEIILEEVNGRIPVVAHVGTADTKTTVELSEHAKKAGASGVGMIAPYYAPDLTEEALYNHFAEILEAVNEPEFPVFVYNNPKISQNPITPNLLKRLAKLGLRGLKDSSFDLVEFFMFQEAVEDYEDFNVIIGTEAIFYGAFEAGATGCICGVGNIFPELLQKMYKKFIEGDKEGAMEMQRLVLKVRQITKLGPTVPLMYEILRMRGIDAGYGRSPLAHVDENSVALAKKELEALKLL